MNVENLDIKCGWISAFRELAKLISDPVAIQALTPVATADATDLATAIALTNANKAKINAIITALKDVT